MIRYHFLQNFHIVRISEFKLRFPIINIGLSSNGSNGILLEWHVNQGCLEGIEQTNGLLQWKMRKTPGDMDGRRSEAKAICESG